MSWPGAACPATSPGGRSYRGWRSAAPSMPWARGWTLSRPGTGWWHLPSTGPGWRTSRSPARVRSEEHTSELQSHLNLVCRLLLEKKKETHHEVRLQGVRDKDHASLHVHHTR